jgi:competence protein ComEA
MRNVWYAALGFLLLLVGTAEVSAGPVDINTADAKTLAAELTGVGPVLAEEIVRDREANGTYPNADALARVKGVGKRIVEMNRENILTSKKPSKN